MDLSMLLTSILVIVVQVSQVKAGTSALQTPPTFTLKLEHEQNRSDVSLAEYAFVLTFAYLCFLYETTDPDGGFFLELDVD